MAELAAYGLLPEDLDDQSVGVWPDNVLACDVFVAMQTQWRSSGYGATGLDYTAIPAVLSLLDVPRESHADTFECLRVMESEALRLMDEQLKKAR